MSIQLDHNVRVEQLRLIYQQGPVLVLGATLAALVVAAFLWRSISGFELLLWLSLVLVSALLRVLVFISFRQSELCADNVKESGRTKPANTGLWGVLFWIGSALAGSVWGLLPVLTAHEISPVYLLLLSTLFAGMVAVVASAGSIYLPSFYAFAVPMVLPLCYIEFRSGVDYLVLTAVLLLLYLMVSALLAQRGSRQYAELIAARERNAQLMTRVTDEKQIAESAVLAKNRFMAAASHDLRQPLHALGMFIGSLRKREYDGERLDIINDMAVSTEALSHLLHSLLDISRLDAGVLQPQPVPVELKTVLNTLAQEFEPQIRRKGLWFEFHADDVCVETDPVLLDRILRNLLGNALRYTECGGISLHASVDAHASAGTRETKVPATGESVVIAVTDTGTGIAAENHQTVFDEYRQVQQQSAGEQGLGLGLSIVKRFCALQNMPLQLDSSLGAGTRFRLRVPLTAERVSSANVSSAYSDWQDTLVLLVDDEPQVRDAMGRRLRDRGCEVITAATAKEAVYQCALAHREPDILLCDYRLRHGESGIDVVAAVREGSGGGLPSLLITGDTSSECLRDAADHALPVIHKPVDEDQLLQAMQHCMVDPRLMVQTVIS